MAAVATGKSWRDFFDKNIHLPAAFDREHVAQQISTPVCIGLNTVEGIIGQVFGSKTHFIANFTCPFMSNSELETVLVFIPPSRL